MNQKDYTAFKAMDFAKDPYFIGWQFMPDEENCLFWDGFRLKHPEMLKEIDRASAILHSVKFNSTSLSLPEQRIETQRMQQRIMKRKKQHLVYRISSIAAACVLCAVFALSYHYLGKEELSVLLAQNPGEMQLLMDGKNTEVPAGASIAYRADGSVVLTKGDQCLALLEGGRKENHLVVPKGRRTILSLSDGTKVWVNSVSEVTFPTAFATNKREVNLSGEVYFEVTKDCKRPFIVKCPDFDVRVLGTKFDVQAYKGEPNHRVILAEGSVQINTSHKGSLKLAPNEMGTITDHGLVCTEVNALQYISWKDGYLCLQSEPLSEVLKCLERYYNVEMEYTPRTGNLKCNGKLVLTDSINDVINCIVSTMPIKAVNKGNKIEIVLMDN